MDFEVSAATATILAALAAVIGSLTTGWLGRRHQKRAINAALLAEVAALSRMIRTRKYCEDLEEAANDAREGHTISFTAPVPAHYCRIYAANLTSIGLLDHRQASDLVQFYQLIDSVVQDITPEGVLGEGSSAPQDFVDASNLLRQALLIGDSLLAKKTAWRRFMNLIVG